MRIIVTFTAKGAMDGGAVSLELPNPDWGEMQDDPFIGSIILRLAVRVTHWMTKRTLS